MKITMKINGSISLLLQPENEIEATILNQMGIIATNNPTNIKLFSDIVGPVDRAGGLTITADKL